MDDNLYWYFTKLIVIAFALTLLLEVFVNVLAYLLIRYTVM